MDNNIIDKRTTGELKISNVLSDKNRIAILSTGKDQRLIAEVVRGENGIGEAKAAFIVKACNEYDKLKEQIDFATNSYKYLNDQYKTLESANRELLEALKIIEARSWHKNEWVEMNEINIISKEAIKKHSPIN